MDWARILAYVTGTVDQELLARNKYLAAGPAPNVIRHGTDLAGRAEGDQGVAGAGRSPDVVWRRVRVPARRGCVPAIRAGNRGRTEA